MPSKSKKLQTFTGTSKKGNLQEAINLAIKSALYSAPGADRMVTWTLKQASGRKGGIAAFNEVTVAIAARIG